MRALLAVPLLLMSCAAGAEIWRWTDAEGRVHYSNNAPPRGVKATLLDPAASGPPATGTAASVGSGPDCHTIRCQGERMEERIARRDADEAKATAQRAATAPRTPRGLDFRKYISIERGMSEGELFVLAGEPDLLSDQGIAIAGPSIVTTSRGTRAPARTGLSMKTWTYLPTPADPFTTTIVLVGGRVSEIDRVRKF